MQNHDSTMNFLGRLLKDPGAIKGLGVDGACVIALRHDESRTHRLICRDEADARRQIARILSAMSARGLVALYATWTLGYEAAVRAPVVVTLAERQKIQQAETHGDQAEADSRRRILGRKLREAHRAGRPVQYEAMAQERPAPIAAAAE